MHGFQTGLHSSKTFLFQVLVYLYEHPLLQNLCEEDGQHIVIGIVTKFLVDNGGGCVDAFSPKPMTRLRAIAEEQMFGNGGCF